MTEPLYKTISNFDRWLITFVVMAATLMEMIDTTIVNVALPHMQGSLSASSDEITWTLTSYIVATAVFMPLTGYLSNLIGRKKYLIISIATFTIASALCGISTTLKEIVIFRLLQGVSGAGLVPLSQAILTDIFPPEDRGKAMAIWGIGVMVGPILGPTLGGYLTELTTWRWAFYVNIPVGIFTLLLAPIIPDVPKLARRMDWLGLALISTAIGGLQYVLDRGNQEDWFDSTQISFISYIAFTAFLAFLWHSYQTKKQTVFDLRIMKDRNFVIASLTLAIFCLALFGMIVVQPLMMEGLMGYPALTAGLILAPRGISGMISMIVVSKLITRISPHILIISGILLCIFGTWLATHYSLYVDRTALILPMILQGFGLGLVFVPLGTVAFATLAPELRTEAAGLYSLLRTLGGSIGISIAITLFTRRTQLFWNELGSSINVYNASLPTYLNPLHLQPTQNMSAAILSNELYHQAAMLAFVNVFAFIMWCFVLMLPLALLLERSNKPIVISDVGH